MSLKIDCLSVYQPWAELLVAGIKTVENRPKNSKRTGLLLIHASKKIDIDWDCKLRSKQLIVAKKYIESVCTCPTKLPRGCIVGSVVQTGCASPDEILNEWHEKGAFGLMMCNAVKFDRPIPQIGRHGIFHVDIQGEIGPDDIMRMVYSIRKWRIRHGN